MYFRSPLQRARFLVMVKAAQLPEQAEIYH